MEILPLTKQIVLQNIKELIEIDRNIVSDEKWDEQNFLIDLPGKWEKSFIVVEDNNIIGFIICSVKKSSILHVHRLSVKKEHQRKGIGTNLLNQISKNINNTIKCVTLNIRKDNVSLQKFYSKSGFKRLKPKGNNYLYWRKIL